MNRRRDLRNPRAAMAGYMDLYEVMLTCCTLTCVGLIVACVLLHPIAYSVGDNQAAYLYPEGEVVAQKGSYVQAETGTHGVSVYSLEGVAVLFDGEAEDAGEDEAETDPTSSIKVAKAGFSDAEGNAYEVSARVVVDFDEGAVSSLGRLYGSQSKALEGKVAPDARAAIVAAASAAPDFSSSSLRAVEKAVTDDLTGKWARVGLEVESVDVLSITKR